MSFEKDLDFITERLGVVNMKEEEPRRKVRVKKDPSTHMDTDKEPIRRMVRASRARPTTSQVKERPLLPLQETPSIASDSKGKDLVRKVRAALQAHRSVKGQLESFKNALDTAVDLMNRQETDKAQKILTEFKRAHDNLQKARENLVYVMEHIDEYRNETMERLEAATPKKRMQYSKILSYFLKYEPELSDVYKDVSDVYPKTQGAFAQLKAQMETRKVEKQFDAIMKGFKKMRV